jgi:hypothetical protein
MKVQAFMLVPSWKLARASQALIMASLREIVGLRRVAGQRSGESAQMRDQGDQLALEHLVAGGPFQGDGLAGGWCAHLTLTVLPVSLTQDIEELVGYGLVDDLIEHLAQLHADRPLPQPRFIERGRTLPPFIHGTLIDHAIGAATCPPPPGTETQAVQRPISRPVPKTMPGMMAQTNYSGNRRRSGALALLRETRPVLAGVDARSQFEA